MAVCWIVVADGSRLSIYTPEKGKLQLVHELSQDENRQKVRDIVSDKLGHHKSKGSAGGDFVPRTDPKKHEIEKFIQNISHFLNKKRIDDAYQELVIVASPGVHGMLNKHINRQVHALIRADIEKNYANLPHRQLELRLGDFL